MAILLTLAGALAIAAQNPRPSDWALGVTIPALLVLSCAPVVPWLIAVFSPADGHAHEEGPQRGALRVMLTIQGIAGIALVVLAILGQAAPWLPVLFTGASALVTALALRTRQQVRERIGTATPEPSEWTPLEPGFVWRRAAVIAAVFAAVFLTLFVVTTLTSAPADERFFVAFQIAAIVASIAGAAVTLSISVRLSDTVGRDRNRSSRIGKAVAGRVAVQLDENERVVAARYATLLPALLGFQAAYMLLLFAGIGASQLAFTSDNTAVTISRVIFTLYPVILCVLIVQSVIRARRARAYSRAHADLLTIEP